MGKTKVEKSIERLKRIYSGMKQRCNNPKCDSYEYYGGRGIKICPECLENIENFIVWALTHGYKDNLSIDRIEVNGNYEPSNCRWATKVEQSRNRRPPSEWKKKAVAILCEAPVIDIKERVKQWIETLMNVNHRDNIAIVSIENEGLLYCYEYQIDLEKTEFSLIEKLAKQYDVIEINDEDNCTEIICKHSPLYIEERHFYQRCV